MQKFLKCLIETLYRSDAQLEQVVVRMSKVNWHATFFRKHFIIQILNYNKLQFEVEIKLTCNLFPKITIFSITLLMLLLVKMRIEEEVTKWRIKPSPIRLEIR